jgi:hypothetical protein
VNPETVIIENGDHRVIAAEHTDEMYLAVGNAHGSHATFLSALDALWLAAVLICGAGRILERQFRRQLGGG